MADAVTSSVPGTGSAMVLTALAGLPPARMKRISTKINPAMTIAQIAS